MANSFEIIVRVGISTKSFSDAVEQAVKEAAKEGTVNWFKVEEHRGRVLPDGNLEFQATVNIGRKLN
ncbi:MAG: dodecin domain-containing protein [Ignavibacteria bacterium]|nr:dodecin domain-containing protein [Ignavibacteria bacterium]